MFNKRLLVSIVLDKKKFKEDIKGSCNIECIPTIKLLNKEEYTELFGAHALARIHPDDAQRFKASVARQLAMGTALRFEYRVIKKDGTSELFDNSKIINAVKKTVNKPIIAKLSPNVTDITAIAKAVEDAGADGVSLINTLLGMRIDLRTRKPVIANKMGGFSGPAIFPVAVRMVYQVANAVKIPVVGMGGVSTAEDVIEMMLAGATAVEVGAANLINPYASKQIIEDLPSVMAKYKIENLSDIIGGVK